MVFCGKPRHRLDAGGDVGIRTWQHKRFAEEQLYLGECRKRISQQLVVFLRKHLDRFLIVDTDQDAEQIGMGVNRVLLPAGGQVSDGVAADALIEEFNLVFRIQPPVF